MQPMLTLGSTEHAPFHLLRYSELQCVLLYASVVLQISEYTRGLPEFTAFW